MDKYLVTIEQEHFKKGGTGYPYKYQCLTDKNRARFKTFEEAKKYVDEYNLEYEISQFDLYVDFLSIFELDDEGSVIGDNLYNNSYDIEKIKEIENIKIEY